MSSLSASLLRVTGLCPLASGNRYGILYNKRMLDQWLCRNDSPSRRNLLHPLYSSIRTPVVVLMCSGRSVSNHVIGRMCLSQHPFGLTLRALVCPHALTRYKRFLFCRENEHARECSQCGHLQIGDPDRPEMRCDSCGATFCYEHGGAHEGRSCAEHEAATAEGELLPMYRNCTV